MNRLLKKTDIISDAFWKNVPDSKEYKNRNRPEKSFASLERRFLCSMRVPTI
jgi:hypothetical protein